jgi:type II secretory pathway predicted ATPase ExeA
MYLEHFGLNRPPFKITPDTSLFFKGSQRGAALDALKYAILSGEGIIKVVGEVGSGKTMLCRMLELELPDNVEVVYIANPSLSPENILHVVAFELKLPVTNSSSKLEVMQHLQNYLLQKHAANRQVVVFVEEAQGMPIETLEEIRLLSNLETNDHKLLQMVLFGQPELDEKLRNPAIRQLKERITHNFYLEPFPPSDIYEYLNFRMRAVGYRGPDIFSPKIATSIEKKSRGLTRRINILADKALLAAYAEGGHGIHRRHIDIAAQDSDFGAPGLRWQPWAWGAGGVILVAAAVWFGTLIAQFQNTSSEIVSAEPAAQTATAPADITPAPAPVAQVVVSAAPQAVAVADALQQRLTATAHWLESVSDEHFTIQLTLVETATPGKTEDYLQRAAAQVGLDNLHVYEALIRGKPVYSVLYSDYSNRDMAVIALLALPETLRTDGAFVRPLKGVRADIQRLADSGVIQNQTGINE